MPWDPYWQSDFVRDAADVPPEVKVPVFLMAAWSDAFLGPQMTTWEALGSRDASVLYVGPYDHVGRPASDLDMPGRNAGIGAGGGHHTPAVVDWLDHHLRGGPPVEGLGQTRSYVGGRDAWVAYDQWPPPHESRALFMSAPSPGCGGTLSARRPTPETATWVHDPADPVPARGGAGMLRWMVPGKGGTPGGTIDPGPGVRAQRRRGLRVRAAGLAAARGGEVSGGAHRGDHGFGHGVRRLAGGGARRRPHPADPGGLHDPAVPGSAGATAP